jgi:hypothetical protein
MRIILLCIIGFISFHANAQKETIRMMCEIVSFNNEIKDEMSAIAFSPDYYIVTSESKQDSTFKVKSIDVQEQKTIYYLQGTELDRMIYYTNPPRIQTVINNVRKHYSNCKITYKQ